MQTYPTKNMHSHYDLTKPITKSKNMPKAMVTNYGLMILKVVQDINTLESENCIGYTKKELVGKALGHIDPKYTQWANDGYKWTRAAFASDFAAFNKNKILCFSFSTRKWYAGKNIMKYVKYHFGPYSALPLDLDDVPFDEAVEHNMHAKIEWDRKKELYKMTKKIGQEIFFQD